MEQAQAREELRERLETARLRARLNKGQLSARATLGRTTVSNALDSTGPLPSQETITALAGFGSVPAPGLFLHPREVFQGGAVSGLAGPQGQQRIGIQAQAPFGPWAGRRALPALALSREPRTRSHRSPCAASPHLHPMLTNRHTGHR